MGCQPQNPWCHGNQNRPLYSLVSSFHRAINWNHPTRVFGPVAVSDGDRLGNKTYGVQGLLQLASNSRWSQGRNSDRNDGIERCQSQILSLAATLSWAVPNTNRRMSTNSPRTGREGGPVGRTDEGAQFRLVESVSLLSRGQSFWSQGVVCKCLARMAGPEAQIDADDQSRLN